MDTFEQSSEDTEIDNELCGICTDVVIDRGVLDNCDHWFCFACIDNWAAITNLCPLCKKEFQLITCLPVYDTTGNIKSEDYSRDDDWCIQGKNNTLAFPSYYIDENAVVCLDGDGCKIRSGLSIAEEDLTLDTSIACDSCDIWYHAFCVGFDPERGASENSWLCPRCVTDDAEQKIDGVPSKNKSNYSSLNNEIGWITDPNFSSKVSISIDDDGETAVVVSMVEAHNETTLTEVELDELENNASNNKLEQLENRVICRTDPSFQSKVSISVADDGEADVVVSLVENQQKTEHVSTDMKDETSLFDTSTCDAELSVQNEENGYSELICDDANKMVFKPPSTDEIACDTFETNNQISGRKSDANFQLDKTSIDIVENMIDKLPKQTESSDMLGESIETIQPNLKDSCCFKNNKRKKEMDTIHQSKKAKSDGKPLLLPSNSQASSSALENLKRGSRTTVPNNDILMTAVSKKSKPPNIMSIVREANPSSTKGLRVKKIMRRVGEKEESFKQLREEIREAARDKPSKTNNAINNFDSKLLTAFRAAIVKPKEELIKKTIPSFVSVKKHVLQKGKARENLTKKIYGTSTGKRRRAWDRDWEIEFWKYRCHTRTTPKKIETLSSVLDILKKATNASLNDPEIEGCEEENSILSRVYLADTSLFPRKDDIKPLSSFGESSEIVNDCTMEKNSMVNKSSTASLISDSGRGKKKAQSSAKETNNQTDLSKIDKKKWAMEVLARKNTLISGSNSKEGEEDKSALKGNYPLLAQLPMDMRPVPAPSRHNKVPHSVRQAQLYRITEHFLRLTNITVMRKTADTELAIADAVNIEKGIFERSNSKLVYINLCAQALTQKSYKPSSYKPIDSDSSTPTVEMSNNQEVEEALRLAGLSSDSPPSSPTSIKECQNVENDTIGLEKTFDMDSCPDEGYELKKSPQQQNGDLKLGRVLSIPNCDNDDTEVVRNDPDNFEGKIDNSRRNGLVEIEITTLQLEKSNRGEIDEEISIKKAENERDIIPGDTKGECIIPCESEKHQSQNGAKDSEFENVVFSDNCIENCEVNNESLDKKIPPARSLASENVPKEKTVKLTGDSSLDLRKSIVKKVEAYVKEHIRPLCKSGVITVEQYRWAVGKTIDKVMKYHHKAKDANFLIKEGEKVKKLAEQYVETAQKKED